MNQEKGVDVPHLLSRWTIGLARRSPFVAGVALVALLTACGSDSTTGPSSSSSSPVGFYTISTVNGKAVPTSIAADGSFSFDVTGGSISLTTDGKFSAITNARQTLPGSVSNFVDTSAGTWTQSGATLQMTFENGTTAPATWDKTSLTGTFNFEGLAFTAVYGNKK
jgi:hypothetical protein